MKINDHPSLRQLENLLTRTLKPAQCKARITHLKRCEWCRGNLRSLVFFLGGDPNRGLEEILEVPNEPS